uniref:Uncharacterized protein n=1 Tax=Cannabis sativa TaxID=3483 RepID=A0A803QHV4_CANSA
MADDTPRNDENHPEETTHRPGKELQASQRTNTVETPRSGSNDGDFDQTVEHILERRSEDAYDPTRYILLVELENKKLWQCLVESNRRNAKLEREAATTSATQGEAPQNQPVTSAR